MTTKQNPITGTSTETTTTTTTNDLGVVNKNNPTASLESSSLKTTFKTTFSQYIFDWVSKNHRWQLTASPWEITAVKKETGEVDEEVCKIIDDVLERSQWDLIRNVIVTKIATQGHSFISVNNIKTSEGNKLFFNVADSAPQWVQPIGSDSLVFSQLIQFWQVGTQPLLWTSTYSPSEITQAEFTQNGQSISLDKFQYLTNVKLNVTKKGYGFVPVVRIVGDVNNTNLTGIPVVDGLVMELAYRCDALFDKILDYMIANTNLVKTITNQGTGLQTSLKDKLQSQVKETLSKTHTVFEFNNTYKDGSFYEIIKGDFNIAPLWDQLMANLMLIGFMTGGVPLTDRIGSYQITDTQRYTSARNSAELMFGQRIQYLITGINKLFRMVEKIGKYDWSDIEFIVDINMSEAGVDFWTQKNPLQALAFNSPIQIYKKLHKVGHRKAYAMLKDWTRQKKEFKELFDFVSNKQDGNKQEGNDGNKSIKDPMSNKLIGVE